MAEAKRPLSPISAYLQYGEPGTYAEALDSPRLEVITSPTGGSSPTEAKKLFAKLLAAPPTPLKGYLVGTEAGSVFWLSADNQVFDWLFSLDGPIHSLSMTADGATVAAVTSSGAGYLWKRATKSLRLVSVAGLGAGKLANLRLNADGGFAMLSMEVSGYDESWYVYYLVDPRGKRKPCAASARITASRPTASPSFWSITIMSIETRTTIPIRATRLPIFRPMY